MIWVYPWHPTSLWVRYAQCPLWQLEPAFWRRFPGSRTIRILISLDLMYLYILSSDPQRLVLTDGE
jgi:hypothetical protein